MPRSLHFGGQAALERKAYMTAQPALPASHGDDLPGPALWEGHSSRSAALAFWLPPFIALGLFAGGWLAAGLMPRIPGTSQLQIGGQSFPLDDQTAAAVSWGAIGLVLLVLGLALGAILLTIVRSGNQLYRVDGQAAESRFDGMTDRIAIADIRRVIVHGYGAWHRVRIVGSNRQRILMLLGSRDAARVLTALRGLGVECGALDAIEQPAEIDTLLPGESVRWRGRPGLASFDTSRAFLLFAVCLPLLFFLGAQWMIWSAEPMVIVGLFFSCMTFCLFGYLALYVLAVFHERLRAWFFDLFGTVVVTDRRIAWAVPLSGRFYRDLAFGELIEAAIVERKGRRAWVALTIRTRDDVRHEDLRGLPDADRFLAVLRPGAQ